VGLSPSLGFGEETIDVVGKEEVERGEEIFGCSTDVNYGTSIVGS
jgi:hypothetical protein